MERIIGIDGLFFKAEKLMNSASGLPVSWGFTTDPYGTNFKWQIRKALRSGRPFRQERPIFNPSAKEFMVNFRVENLANLLDVLRQEGVTIIGEIEEHE